MGRYKFEYPDAPTKNFKIFSLKVFLCHGKFIVFNESNTDTNLLKKDLFVD